MMKTLKNRKRSALCRILIEARTRTGLSQRQLARRLGRAHSYVAKIEAGDRRVEVAEFMVLARALGQDPKALLAQVQDRQREDAATDKADTAARLQSNLGENKPNAEKTGAEKTSEEKSGEDNPADGYDRPTDPVPGNAD